MNRKEYRARSYFLIEKIVHKLLEFLDCQIVQSKRWSNPVESVKPEEIKMEKP